MQEENKGFTEKQKTKLIEVFAEDRKKDLQAKVVSCQLSLANHHLIMSNNVRNGRLYRILCSDLKVFQRNLQNAITEYNNYELGLEAEGFDKDGKK